MNFDPQNYSLEFISSCLIKSAEKRYTFQAKNSSCREAAVLVPLIHLEKQWHLLFTKRSQYVKQHKGQVSFPGGLVEPADDDVISAALRETFEEIGAAEQDIQVLGMMEAFSTTSNFWVTPVVGLLNWPITLTVSKTEVTKVFTIPLAWFGEEGHIHIIHRPTTRCELDQVIYYKEFDHEVVWGVTAKVVNNLIRLITTPDKFRDIL